MKKALVIIFVFASFILNGQNLPSSSKLFIEKSLIEDGVTSDFSMVKENFSKLWLKDQDAVVGFIGNNYQRIFMRFISVIRNEHQENEYFVYGKSRVKGTVCDFQGRLIITHILLNNQSERKGLYEEALKHGDQEAIERFGKTTGFVLAEYIFFEDPRQAGSGIFKGAVKSNFYIKQGVLYYDDLGKEFEAAYANNQFVGVWEGYTSEGSKPCNWGAYRIPKAGELDVGVGEFSPNTRYLKNGWQTYYDAYIKSKAEARKEEESEWWE